MKKCELHFAWKDPISQNIGPVEPSFECLRFTTDKFYYNTCCHVPQHFVGPE